MLEGSRIVDIACLNPTLDLMIDFNDGLKLYVFADFVPASSNVESELPNWELGTPIGWVLGGRGRRVVFDEGP